MNARTLDAAIDAAEEFLREAITLREASREGAPGRAAWSAWFDKHAENQPMPAYQSDPINGSLADPAQPSVCQTVGRGCPAE
jgi:hypothetical protein